MSAENTSTDSGSKESRSSEGRGNATLILALIVVAAIAIAGVVSALVLREHHTDAGSSAAATSSTWPPAPRPNGSGGDSGFGTPELDEFGRRVDIPADPAGQPLPQTVAPRRNSDPDWLTGAPAGTRDRGGWQRIGSGVVVPFSTSDGPTAIVDGVATGYSHTPQGAALAAASVVWRISAEPGNKALWDHCLVTTPQDMTRYAQERAAGRLPDLLPVEMARLLRAFDAFRVNSFAEDLAVVELAMRKEPDPSGSPRWASMRLPMIWDGENQMWRLEAPFGKPPLTELHSLAGWTTW
jgi:hypothetical protein